MGEKQAIKDLKKTIGILRAENRLDERFIKYRDQTPLTWAVSEDQIDVVKILLDADAKVEAQNYYGTALMHAANAGNLKLFYFLLDKKANVNARDRHGQTALIKASRSGQSGTMRALLKAGAEIDAQDEDGTTALMEAARTGKLGAVNILLKAGANIDAQDKKKKTALMKIMEDDIKWELGAIKILLKAHIQNEMGHTAESLAKLKLYEEILANIDI